jgi:hypothetical protein
MVHEQEMESIRHVLLGSDHRGLSQIRARLWRRHRIDEFFRLFWDRRSGSKSKIPKAMEAPFLMPQNDAEARMKEAIVEFSADQTAKLEEDLFKQRTRLADAERTLLTKTTKAATESQRIATDKIV